MAKGRAKIPPPGRSDRIALIDLLDFLVKLGQTHALSFWLNEALTIDTDTLPELFGRLPKGLADRDVQEFARAFIDYTREKLATLRKEIYS